MPKRIRSGWRVKSRRVARGWRPSSPTRAEKSRHRFGIGREHAVDPRRGPRRSSTTCAPMNVVPGWPRDHGLERVHQALEAGQAGAVGRPLRVHAELLQALVVASSGSKNATGSAVWISTGSPSSPAAPTAAPAAASSGRTSAPAASRTASPRSFHTFNPRAPGRDARPSRLVDQASSGVGLEQLAPVDVAERQEAPRVRAVVAVEVGLELVAPAAVEVHDRLDVERVHQRQQLADVGGHPAAVGAHPVREPAAEVVVGVDGAGTAGRATSVAGTLSEGRGW